MSTVENLKKHRSDSFTITDDASDLPPAKRVRESAESDTSSVVASEEDRLSKMAQAVKTLIEVDCVVHYASLFITMLM